MHEFEEPPVAPDRAVLYLAVAVILALIAIATVLFVLFQGIGRPRPQPALRLVPAAAPLDDLSDVTVISMGWPRGEEVTVCLARPRERECDLRNIVAVEEADSEGRIEVNVRVASLLAEGLTRFIARGQQTGQVVSKSFRILQRPSPLPATPTPTPRPTVLVTATSTLTAAAVTTPTAAATPTAPFFAGWRAEYFANPDLQGQPVLVRDEPRLAFDWGTGAPDPVLPADGFSARWTRQFAFLGRRYRFTVRADDGVRLLLDGAVVLDEWHNLMLEPEHSVDVDLLPGEHQVQLEFYEDQGQALIALDWQISEDFPDWRGEYYDNPDLAGDPVVVRNDQAIDFDWRQASPFPGLIGPDGFSARWQRTTDFVEGTYRFIVLADDGVRLLVDDQLLLDRWTTSGEQPYVLEWPLSAGPHAVRLEFYENVGMARVSLHWELASGESPTPEPTTTPTATATPTSSPTATATPSATPTPTPSPTATWTATPTATATATLTPSPTPTPRLLATSVEPVQGWAGTMVTVRSQGWPADAEVTVALLELGADIGLAVDLAGTRTIVPADGSIQINFVFPDDPRWLTQPAVQIILHDPNWWLRGPAVFTLVAP